MAETKFETSAFVRILEEAAYLVTEPVGCRPRWRSGSLLQARLLIGGDGNDRPAMTLVLVCSARLAVEIAATMMGIEPAAEQAAGSAEDALGEVLNMVAGMLCEEWGDAGIEVGIPRVEVTSDLLVHEWAAEQVTVTLLSDKGDWLLAGLDTGDGAAG